MTCNKRHSPKIYIGTTHPHFVAKISLTHKNAHFILHPTKRGFLLNNTIRTIFLNNNGTKYVFYVIRIFSNKKV